MEINPKEVLSPDENGFDLRTCLLPGDLFVSYWIEENQIIVAVGDNEDIKALDCLSSPGLLELVDSFDAQVTRIEHYQHFIAKEYRPSGWPPCIAVNPSIDTLCKRLSVLLVTDALADHVRSGKYRRLLIFPDWKLNILPIHLLVDYAIEPSWHDVFVDGVIYAPSASAYIYMCRKRRAPTFQHAAVLIGDKNDDGMRREVAGITEIISCRVDQIERKSQLELLQQIDLLYICAHGKAATDYHEATRSSSSWSLKLKDDCITEDDFFSGRFKLSPGSLVVMSACSVGRVVPGQAHELLGLIQSLFFAGAGSVLASRWPILAQTSDAVFRGTISKIFKEHNSLGTAFVKSIVEAAGRDDISTIEGGSGSDIFFWGPFVLFGNGD